MDEAGAALFEHRFRLQVLGDHARFIRDSLGPKEQEAIDTAKRYVHQMDSLLEVARSPVSDQQALIALASQANADSPVQIRHLAGKIGLTLTPTFINHMVNEVEEYLWILLRAFRGLLSEGGGVGGVRFNRGVEWEMVLFQEFLRELETFRMDNEALGVLTPLMADRMFRNQTGCLLRRPAASLRCGPTRGHVLNEKNRFPRRKRFFYASIVVRPSVPTVVPLLQSGCRR